MTKSNLSANLNQKKFFSDLRKRRQKYKEDPIVGKRLLIERDGTKEVEVLMHVPKKIDKNKKIPVYFNMHGGAWLAGDARSMESFCSFISNETGIIVVNINYTKIDEETYPFATDEVVDTINYFIKNSHQHNYDSKKMIVGGFSAGGQIASTAAIKLNKHGIKLAGQLLCYPCVSLANEDIERIDDQDNSFKALVQLFMPKGMNESSNVSPLKALDDELIDLCPTSMIVCGKDTLREQAVLYSKRLIELGVPLRFKEYRDAFHGFIEVNQPEHSLRKEGQTSKQKELCNEAMNYIAKELKNLLSK